MRVAAERSVLTLRKNASLSARDRCTPQASNMNNYDTSEGNSGREVEEMIGMARNLERDVEA
jgi:hypothetical protein